MLYIVLPSVYKQLKQNPILKVSFANIILELFIMVIYNLKEITSLNKIVNVKVKIHRDVY